MDRIIIKTSYSHSEILQHLSRYVDMYNNFLVFRKNYNLYLENTADGIIFFYRDLSMYHAIVDLDEQLLKKLDKNLPPIKDPFILQMFLSPTLFPAIGTDITFQIISGPIQEIFQTTKSYFRLFDPDLQFSDLQGNQHDTFIMHLSTYQPLVKYTHFLIRRYIQPEETN